MKRIIYWTASLTVLLVTAGVTATRAQKPDNQEHPRVKAHKVFYRIYDYDASGKMHEPAPDQITTTVAGAEVITTPDGKAELSHTNPGSDGRYNCGAFLQKTHKYDRIETVAGFRAYIKRTPSKDPNSLVEFTEQAFAPETGCTPLKQLAKLKSGIVSVREVTRVVWLE